MDEKLRGGFEFQFKIELNLHVNYTASQKRKRMRIYINSQLLINGGFPRLQNDLVVLESAVHAIGLGNIRASMQMMVPFISVVCHEKL